MKDTFKVIPKGVLKILYKPTQRTEDNPKVSIKEHYPDHANTLARSGIGMKNFPTLKELWENEDEREKKKKEKLKRKREGKYNAYFCIGFSQLWREKIHNLIKTPENPMA